MLDNEPRYFEFADPNGMFMVDMDRVAKILYSFERSILLKDGAYSKPTKINSPDKSLLENLLLPEIYVYETNWDNVKNVSKNKAQQSLKEICLNTLKSQTHMSSVASPLYNRLRLKVRETRINMDLYQKKCQEISKQSMEAINKNLDKWDLAIKGAKATRDISSDFLIIGGTVLPLAKAGGVALKSIGKYQDTGSIGQATLEGVTTIIFLKIPDPSGKKGELALLLAKSVSEGGKAYLETKDIEKAFKKGLITGITEGAMSAIMKSDAAKKAFFKAALPVRTHLVSNNIAIKHTSNLGLPSIYLKQSKTALDFSKKAVSHVPEKTIKSLLDWAVTNIFSTKGSIPKQSTLDSSVFCMTDNVDVGVYKIN